MVELLPVTGHVVDDAHAAASVAPPYDLLTPERYRDLRARSATSFLGVLPSPDDGAEGLAANRARWEDLLAAGHYAEVATPFLGVLVLEVDGAATVAIIGDVEVAAYRDGRVLPHERVRPARVTELVEHLEVVGVVSSPVCVTHRPSTAVTTATDRVRGGTPEVAFVAGDGVRLTLHVVTDPEGHRLLSAAVVDAGQLFIADGHHRAAAVAAARRERVLTAVVPSDHLRVAPFHRRIDGLGEARAARALDLLGRADLHPEPLIGPSLPEGPGRVHLTIGGRWWALDLRGRRRAGPIEGLDVRLVEREVLEPLARLAQDSATTRIVTVPGPSGLDALIRPGAVGLAMHPPAIDEVLAVAEAGGVMPPKSTYLQPKLRSGLVVVQR